MMPDLSIHGLSNLGHVYYQLKPPILVEEALRRGEGVVTDRGAFNVLTGKHTGRSPRDRYLVPAPGAEGHIAWGAVNRSLDPELFDRLHRRVCGYFQKRDLFVNDLSACADPRHQLGVRVITDTAWQALFAQCLLRPPQHDGTRPPDLTILCASGMVADPVGDELRSDVFIVLNFAKGLVLIGGTQYAGEIKKSVFSYLNYLLPQRGVFPMHCSANIGPGGETALFFGLSGTGKTTLSADPERSLIGDDEHGWSDEGVFNIEGGCYAKTIRLSRKGEPQIYNALRFGSILENVVIDPVTRRPDFDDQRYTENTRAAYPVDYIDRAEPTSRGGHPRTILFLTCDAFGVLPPISKLTTEQAMYHFLLGYTAKVAGTESGVTEPQATFSTCFAAPFLPRHPTEYAHLLQDRLAKHGSEVWLVNTGWTGGPYGKGTRIALSHTRAVVRAALNGLLDDVSFTPDPIFGLHVPTTCPGVPGGLLQPRDTWPDEEEYDNRAHHLAEQFRKHFEPYASEVSEVVRQAGPLASRGR